MLIIAIEQKVYIISAMVESCTVITANRASANNCEYLFVHVMSLNQCGYRTNVHEFYYE